MFLLRLKGVVVVGAVHNDFQDPEVKGLIGGLPERLADPDNRRQYDPGLILVGGIDKNSWISPYNPHRRWMAMAPGFGVWAAANAGVEEYEEVTGASYGKLPFFHSSAGTFIKGGSGC